MNKLILPKLNALLQMQRELLAMMKAMDTISALPDVEEEWLKKDAVMDVLCIGERTFYRRLNEGKWTKHKSGGTWYYLKASLFRNRLL